MSEIKVKLIYDDTPDMAADRILEAVKKISPNIVSERLEGGDGFEEYLIKIENSSQE